MIVLSQHCDKNNKMKQDEIWSLALLYYALNLNLMLSFIEAT